MSEEAKLEALLQCLAAAFEAGGAPSTLELAGAHPEWGPHDRVVGLCRALQNLGYVALTLQEKTLWALTPEGQQYAANGMPEANLLRWMHQNPSENGYSAAELKQTLGTEGELGLLNALKLGLCVADKETKRIYCKGGPPGGPGGPPDTAQGALKAIQQWQQTHGGAPTDMQELLLLALREVDPSKQPEKLLQELKRRKLVEQRKVKFNLIKKAEKFKLEISKPLADINAKLIANDQWRQQELKPYNFFACGTRLRRGALHPLMLVQKQFKHVLTSMGFEEMDTNQFVEGSFWCFDALYMPQQHPARDAQDTFFIKSPECSDPAKLPKPFVSAVQQMHESGGGGSTGWGYTWSLEESLKNVMRTHTTSVSARMLYQMAEEYRKTGVFRPRKLFSIDRVFRNETLDATHLAEFHQVEGVVAGENLSLGHLMGVMVTFYKAIGIEELKFKPTFNPYTEPSMEIFGYHPGLKRWIEVGNSGMFRPEMLGPMGLPPEVSVIAWGLSLERPTMIKYGSSNIRELFGPKALLGGV